MNKLGIVGIVLSSIVILMAQIFIFKDLILFSSAICFLYVLIFLILPTETNHLLQIALGFGIGLIIDMFYNTQGVHASASTFLMFVRPFWINILSPGSGYGASIRLDIRTQGLQWFLTYLVPLVFAHCLILFFAEVFGIDNFWLTLKKAFFSTLFTSTVIIIIQYLFLSRDK